MHIDMDAFFASVELVGRPDLRGRPVIVGGSERAVVLAASYEARAFGVHSAMPMGAALRMCPHATVIRPNHREYRRVSAGVMEMLRDVTPLVEQVSIDEAFLDVSGARRRIGPPSVIAAELRRRIESGFGITASVGIAASKSVAKLASSHAKPNGVLLVPRAATVDFLHSLPVGALWGVGEKTADVLARWGIRTVAELARTEPTTLQRAVGQANGRHLMDLAWGRDPRAVEPRQDEKSIGAETTFVEDTAEMALIEARLLALADQCGSRLRERGLVARTVAVKVRTEDFRTLTRAITLDSPTDVSREIYLAARALIAGADLRGLRVRLVGVRAENLEVTQDSPRQLTLEEAVLEDHGAQRDAERALDEVRQRFGRSALGPAALVSPSRPVEVTLLPHVKRSGSVASLPHLKRSGYRRR
jgi:DNA polymerase-4